MTVAELIAELVALDLSTYTVDVRCLPLAGNIVPPSRDPIAHDQADLKVLGIAQVVQNHRPGGSTDGWVTLELEEDTP